MLSKTRTSKLQSSSSWKQMQSSWSLLRASPLEPRHTSQNTSHLVIYPWIDPFFFVDTNLLESILIYWSLVQFWFVFTAFCFRSWLSQVVFPVNSSAGEVVNRPALPGNRPLSEADPMMHDLVIQETPKSCEKLWDVVFFRQKNHLFPKKTTYTYLRYELPRWDTALILLST